MSFASGEFIRFKTADLSADPVVGLVLKCSSNHLEDGSTEDYVEVIGPLPIHLVRAEDVTPFNEKPKPDPKAVKEGSSGKVGGLGGATDNPEDDPEDTPEEVPTTDPKKPVSATAKSK
jgi:hypothetical protein